MQHTIIFTLIMAGFFTSACHRDLSQTESQINSSNVHLSPYLIKDSSLYNYFEIDETGIRLYATPIDKRMETPEIHIYPDEYERFQQLFVHLSQDSVARIYEAKGSYHWRIDEFRKLTKTKIDFHYGQDSLKPLKGLRVALDPGHIAADVEEGEIEGKYVKMRPSPQTRMQRIRFNEATLTLATAYLIKAELEALGAEVLLSRTEVGKGARNMNYQEWRKNEFENTLKEEQEAGRMTAKDATWWRTKATELDLYRRLFTAQDLRYRAQKINDFHPHLTLIIHYNIDSPNWERRDANGFFPPTGANYCMAFVPGSFMRGELNKQADRISFLRLLLTGDIKESTRLTKHFIRVSNRLTGVPIIPAENELGYLTNACILTEYEGVYARNLTLTNLIQGPLCYGESLCQDNVVEALALNKRDIEVGGIPTSSRLEDVAKAYIRSVISFAREGITPQ